MSPDELRDAAQSGGPPKDGIPSIDDPAFVAPDAADYLDPGDPVFGVASGEKAKAYPQKILAQHEIVNDELNGTPVAVIGREGVGTGGRVTLLAADADGLVSRVETIHETVGDGA